MEIAVTDHARGPLGGLPGAEPAHSVRQAGQPGRLDAPVERGEMALEADRVPVEAPAGRPALVVQCAQQRLRIERVQPRVRLAEHPPYSGAAGGQERAPGRPLHHEERGAQGPAVGAGDEHARHRIPEPRERVLGGALPERAHRVVARVQHAQDERGRPPVGAAAQAKGVDRGVEAAADRGRRLGVGEIDRAQLAAEVSEEGGRYVRRRNISLTVWAPFTLPPPPLGERV